MSLTDYIWISQDGRTVCGHPEHSGGYLAEAIRSGSARQVIGEEDGVMEVVTALDSWIGLPSKLAIAEGATCETCDRDEVTR
jgi:hypothetical protein